MRFHVVSLPHTQTTKDYVNCAHTEKVRRFCMMMKNLGHTVYLYAGDQNEALCDELITCITEEQRAEALDGKHFTAGSYDNTLPHWQMFMANAIEGISKRVEQKDFLCFVGGSSQKPIADAFPNHINVEFGVGYGGVFSKFKVFESYSWMHCIYSSFANPTTVDGNFFDTVIPGYLEPEMFPLQKKKEDYYLYIGRLIDRKGWKIAQAVCQEMGARFVVAGPGEFSGYGEYLGPVGAKQRAELMGGAIAMFAPTLYIEPFGYVVIEAQMCGTPTITTDWGAFTETNIDGLTGYRCRSGKDFAEAAEKVKDLNPLKIHKRALSLYSVDVISLKYEEYFQRLLTLWNKGWYERE